MLTKQQIKNFLEHQAYKLRVLSLEMTTKAKSGHPTSCLSAADLVSALFFMPCHMIHIMKHVPKMIALFYQKDTHLPCSMPHGISWELFLTMS